MLMTLADALGQLADEGCRPRRTIKIAHWDAEEYGIIGSVEWVEQFRDELAAHAIAYVNADSAVAGPRFGASSSPSLKAPLVAATKAVPYPGTDGSVYDWWLARGENDTPRLGNLGGGGSDHVGLYSHVGVPSASAGFGAERSGVYHSNYDNFAWFERFGDHEFVFGPTLAKVDGIFALRLANADVLPYDVRRYAIDLREHTETLVNMAEDRGLTIDTERLDAATLALDEAAAAWVETRDDALATEFPAEELRAVNEMLIGLERAFIYDEGLQGRPWYRSLYASPDPFSGYASWMLPGLRYEVETESQEGLRFWATAYAEAVSELGRRVEALTEALQR
jgi:N-acetylated-alpha-linked acidic dipeptidase